VKSASEKRVQAAQQAFERAQLAFQAKEDLRDVHAHHQKLNLNGRTCEC
jgi:hypothetical protein